jgi:protein-S-isoprenylcysteine O-methyltransferase Ste14
MRGEVRLVRDVLSKAWLAARSLLWVVVLPGTMTGYLPWRYFGLGDLRLDSGDPMHLAGGLFVVIGALFLARCIWEFAATGRGTLSPVDPPRELVVSGLYRYVRNPMYLSVATILLGEVLLTRSTGLLTFAAVGFVIVNLFVIGYEEPHLRRQFGASYERYTASVGRWVPRGAFPRR